MGAKGYVVRGRYADGSTCTGRYVDLDEAASYRAERCRWGGTDVTIFAVVEDGTEVALPSYKEAVNKLSLLREMASAALDWQRPGGMRPTHPPELAGCPAGALREILRIVGPLTPLPSYEEALAEVERLRAEVAHLKAPPSAHDLTPSEVACAKVLAAWVAWFAACDDDGAEHDAMNDIGDTLHRRGLIDGELTATSRDLFDRARRAGILGVSAAERAAWARYVNAVIDDRDARFAEEQEQHGAEEWRERTKAALAAATHALRDLGVDVDALLKSAEDI